MSEYKYRKFLTPGIGSPLFHWLKIISTWKKGPVPWKYKLRAATVGSISLALTPFRWWESLRYRGKVTRTELHPEPVFILGHWRSGTTHIHNLLSLDPQFGVITYLHSVFPHAFMGNRILPWGLKNFMPGVRPMDNMKINSMSPQECELALLNYGPYSSYHGWHFPRQQLAVFDRYVLFQGVEKDEYEKWKQTYLRMLQKAALSQKKSRLVLKNPPHTARVKALLELFPRAKFIHIYRNPYTVYLSAKNLQLKTTPQFQLHDIPESEAVENVLLLYEKMMKAWFGDRHLIPKENLIEVRYEDFVQDRESGLKAIYEQLDLQGYEDCLPIWRNYLDTKKDFKKARYKVIPSEIEKMEKRWAFTIERWGYSNPYA